MLYVSFEVAILTVTMGPVSLLNKPKCRLWPSSMSPTQKNKTMMMEHQHFLAYGSQMLFHRP